MSKYGFVYLLKSYDKEDVYKIGKTQISPSERCEQINSNHPSAKGFDLLCYIEVESPYQMERFFHKELEQYRIPSTELFETKLENIAGYFYHCRECFSFCDVHLLPELLSPLENLKDPYGGWK